MRTVDFVRVDHVSAAIDAVAYDPSARFLAGGTTLVDLMKCGVEQPGLVVDITDLPGLDAIEVDGSRLYMGALARMSDVAEHPGVRERWPAVSEALATAASPQLRNMATIGGNLMQRTRCSYFRDPVFAACNKRDPGSGCAALDGENRTHAVLGTSEHCIATYPGDLAVALVALDAVVHTRGPEGRRSFAIDDFFLLPGDSPQREHPLAQGELITAVEVPASALARRSHYVKVRDRDSYEFAAASAAVALDLAVGTIVAARLALGGVATKPWRERAVEAALIGKPAGERVFRQAAALAAADARSREHNAYKVELARRTVARALMIVGGL
ncbi:MAG TPA: xanthine dehydrogenase family protein subunit M [Candidatus Dormibacteraeota bacterium]